MAEGDGFVFNHFKEQVLLGAIDLVTDQIKVALISSGWTPTIDGDVGYATVSANELSGTGYTAGGEILGGTKSVTQDDTNNRAAFDTTVDTTWTGLDAGTPGVAFMYDDAVTTPVADPGIAYWEVTTPSNGGDYTLQWNANGILLLT